MMSTVFDSPAFVAALIAVATCIVMTFMIGVRLTSRHERSWAHPFHPMATVRLVKWSYSGDHRVMADNPLSALVWVFRLAFTAWILIWVSMLATSWTTN